MARGGYFFLTLRFLEGNFIGDPVRVRDNSRLLQRLTILKVANFMRPETINKRFGNQFLGGALDHINQESCLLGWE